MAACRRSEVQVHVLPPTAESGKMIDVAERKHHFLWQFFGAAAHLICRCRPQEQGQAGEGERARLPQRHSNVSKHALRLSSAAIRMQQLHLHSAYSKRTALCLAKLRQVARSPRAWGPPQLRSSCDKHASPLPCECFGSRKHVM